VYKITEFISSPIRFYKGTGVGIWSKYVEGPCYSDFKFSARFVDAPLVAERTGWKRVLQTAVNTFFKCCFQMFHISLTFKFVTADSNTLSTIQNIFIRRRPLRLPVQMNRNETKLNDELTSLFKT